MDLKGKAYAQVKDRLQEFRQQNPNGLIETAPTIQPDGQILFKARILKDKADTSSAEASGHALGPNKGDKAFEKLETIAVGRALALLGYATDGEIASSEEMEEFLEHRGQVMQTKLEEWTAKLEAVGDMDALKKVWADMPLEFKKALEERKEELKAMITTEAHDHA